MTDEEKKIHELKFEIRQQRLRCDRLEEELVQVNNQINNILKNHLEEMQIITILVNGMTELIKEREEKK